VDAAMLKLDPGNEKTQRSYEIDLTHLGNVLRDQDRDTAGALDTYRKCLEMALALNRHSPTTQHLRDVAVSYYQIASVYSDFLGDSQQALENYRKALEIYQQAIAADPANALLRQGLAIAYANVGWQEGMTGDKSGSIAAMDQSLEIMRNLVAQSPQNVRQKDTLAQMYVSRGDNSLRWHRSEQAIQDYEDARAIYSELRARDSADHIDLDIAGCRTKFGFAALQAGRTDAASAAFHGSLALVEPFLAVDKPDLGGFYRAADSYAGLGDVEALQGANRSLAIESRREHWKQALDWYLKSSQIWERVPPNRRDRHSGSPAEPDLNRVANNLHQCEAALASMHSAARLP
jgi:tetratricopeptide (TPR) repeat protein